MIVDINKTMGSKSCTQSFWWQYKNVLDSNKVDGNNNVLYCNI